MRQTIEICPSIDRPSIHDETMYPCILEGAGLMGSDRIGSDGIGSDRTSERTDGGQHLDRRTSVATLADQIEEGCGPPLLWRLGGGGGGGRRERGG